MNKFTGLPDWQDRVCDLVEAGFTWDSLSQDDREKIAGEYLVEEYGEPLAFEPISEATFGKPWALDFLKQMAGKKERDDHDTTNTLRRLLVAYVEPEIADYFEERIAFERRKNLARASLSIPKRTTTHDSEY